MPSARNLTILVNTIAATVFSDPADDTLVVVTKSLTTGVPTAVDYGVLLFLEHTSTINEEGAFVRIWTGETPGGHIVQVNLRGEGVSMTGTIVTG